MERLGGGGIARRLPETDEQWAAARTETERLERATREDIEHAAEFLKEVVAKSGSYSQAIPLDKHGEINRESFSHINAGRNLLERARSVTPTLAGLNAFLEAIKKQCPEFAFSLGKSKEGDFLNLKVESRKSDTHEKKAA